MLLPYQTSSGLRLLLASGSPKQPITKTAVTRSPVGDGDRWEGKNYPINASFLYILHNLTPSRTYPAWFTPPADLAFAGTFVYIALPAPVVAPMPIG
jgi:hypothetical protein